MRLIPAQYVKSFVKRHKNDTVDAEAITVAATRPSMQIVAVKTEEQQTMAAQFRTRDLFMRRRTQLINALRGHLLEFGAALSQGQYNHTRLIRDTEEVLKQDVPKATQVVAKTYLRQIKTLTKEIEVLEKILKSDAKTNSQTRRLQTMPGVGPLTAFAIGASCPSAHDFKTGHDFSSWLGLVPRQHSTGGKQRLGRITKMGQADVGRLLIIGAISVIAAAGKAPDKADPWLLRMLEKRPRMVVCIALANRMARRLWAMLQTERDYEIQGVAA